MNRFVRLRQQAGVELARAGPEEDVRLVPDLPVMDAVFVVPYHLPRPSAILFNSFVGVGLRPAGPVAEQPVDADSVTCRHVQKPVIIGEIELPLARLEDTPLHLLARPLDARPLGEGGDAVHVLACLRAVPAVEVQASTDA